MTWDELAEKLKSGSEEAFRRLVEENQDRIVNTCFGFVENRQDAEDIAQTVFIQAYKSIHKFRGDSTISTWLYRIAVNYSLNFIKSKKRRQIFQSIENTFVGNKVKEYPDRIDTDSIEKEEQLKLLQSFLKELPENQKIAITLNKYEELSYQEVADIMGISLSAVTALINRGKNNLRKKVEKFYKKNQNNRKES